MNDWPTVSDVHDYSVFGLNVRSSLPLPELFAAVPGTDPDVVISTGAELQVDDPVPAFSAVDDAILISIPEIGRFHVSGGREIRVEPLAGVPDRNLRLYLLGSAFGALLHQRGLLPLHANAVEVDGSAVAFMGESGSGKSTLATWFHDQGHKVVADDVCAVHFHDDGRPFTLPGLPRFRLWQPALEAFGRSSDGLARSYSAERFDKFDLPLAADTAVAKELPLGAIYVLERGETLQFQRLAGVEAAEAVIAHTYRGRYVTAARNERGHWQACIRLARHIPIFRAARPWSLDQINPVAKGILNHVRGCLANAGQN